MNNAQFSDKKERERTAEAGGGRRSLRSHGPSGVWRKRAFQRSAGITLSSDTGAE